MDSRPRTFWRWLGGTGSGHAGWIQVVNWWLLLHGSVGCVLGVLVPRSIADIGQTVLLPLAGVLVGLSFAWIGSALAIVDTREIRRLATVSKLGFETYVYTFQLAVLILLVCLSLWGIGALGVFERPCLWACSSNVYLLTKSALLATLSLAVRECWHVVSGVQMMILYRRAVQDLEGRDGTRANAEL